MRTLRMHGARDARVEEVPEPGAGPGRVTVRVQRAGICGSDLGVYGYMPVPAGSVHPLLGTEGPHALGHELAGTVEEVGEGVDGVAVGALVAVRPNVWDGTCPACRRGETNLCEQYGFVGIHGGGGGFAERVAVDADAAHELPAHVGPDAAAMVESTTVAWRAVKVSGVRAGGTALVVGAGPIGLALVLCLRARGVSDVVVSEPSRSRRDLAAELGARVVDPREQDVREVVRAGGAGGVDVSFDASGAGAPTFSAAFDALRSGGTTVVVAQLHGPVEMDLNTVLTTEKHVTGSFAYTDADFAEVVAMVADGTIDPRPLISSHLLLDQVVEGGLEHLLADGRSSEVKVLVDLDR